MTAETTPTPLERADDALSERQTGFDFDGETIVRVEFAGNRREIARAALTAALDRDEIAREIAKVPGATWLSSHQAADAVIASLLRDAS